MKYLLCNTTEKNNKIHVESEVYENFADAVKRYTLLCDACNHVLLANLEKEEIIRQYAHESGYSTEGGTSDAICIL